MAYAARGLLNILETYPSHEDRAQAVQVLILHGGPLDSLNCIYTNRANDIPCNHGNGPNLPADFTYVEALLNAPSTKDNYQLHFHLNITGANLPFNVNDAISIETCQK